MVFQVTDLRCPTRRERNYALSGLTLGRLDGLGEREPAGLCQRAADIRHPVMAQRSAESSELWAKCGRDAGAGASCPRRVQNFRERRGMTKERLTSPKAKWA